MQDGTRAQQCLTRLCELTGSTLLLDVWPIVLRIARLVRRFRNDPVSPEATFRFETELSKLLTELGRRIVEWAVNHLEPRDETLLPNALFWERDHYRRKRLTPTRNLNCLFGKIRLWRWLYEPTEGSGLRSLFPLELRLGLVCGVATPALADRVAQLAVDFSQRQLLGILRGDHQVCWGTKTLRKVTTAMAEGMSAFRHAAQVEQLMRWLREAHEKSGPRRIVLSVGRDGVMLPIRNAKNYREGAAATVSVFNRWGQRLGTVYLGQMPEAGQQAISEQLTRLVRDVLAKWDGPLPRLVYVTDAGFHPSEYFAKVLSRLPNPHQPGTYYQWQWVVDYYHACHYISRLADAIFGPGRAAHAWAAKMRRWLKEKPSGVFRVLRSAGALRTIRGLVEQESDYQTAYAYLRNHAGSMDYRTYRRLRTPIGSGVTEAACKILFTQRFKRAGMKWNIDDGKSVLALRVIALSDIWPAARNAMLQSSNMKQPRTPKAVCEKQARIAS